MSSRDANNPLEDAMHLEKQQNEAFLSRIACCWFERFGVP
jgi:hypothetical protein